MVVADRIKGLFAIRSARVPASVSCLALTLLLAGCGQDPEKPLVEILPVRKGLNVLVVSFDALRADALGCYGYPRRTSPNIDALAARAVVFQDASSASPVTPTSFAAAFTGMYPTRVFKDWKLQAEMTLSEVFKSAGYRTVAVMNNAQLSPSRNFNRGWDFYDYHLLSDDELILERAVALLEQQSSEKFLMWVHFVSPHAPYDRRDGAEHLYDPGYSGVLEDSSGMHFDALIKNPRELKRLRQLYDGEVFGLDDIFGRLRAKLKDLGIEKNTIIVLTSDHGEEFLEHGELEHGTLFENGLRIPLILYHPEVDRGYRISSPVSNVDLLPTLSALVGIPLENEVDGRNLLDPTQTWERLIATSYTDARYHAMSIRRGPWKVILQIRPRKLEFLFNLEEDPGEEVNLLRQFPDVSRQLGQEVWQVLGGEEALLMGSFTDPSQGLDPEALNALRALGYIGTGDSEEPPQ